MLQSSMQQSRVPSTARHIPRTAVDVAIEALAVVGIAIRLLLPLVAWGALPLALPGYGMLTARPTDAGGWSTLLVPASALMLGTLGLLVARWPPSVRQRVVSRLDGAGLVYRQGGRMLRLLALECAWLLALCEWVAVTDPTGAARVGLVVGVSILVLAIAITPSRWVAGMARTQPRQR